MDLDRTSAAVRPRRAWEGLDLGFALAREWFLPLWALWWLTAAPAMLLGGLWLHDRPDLLTLLVWWFKPLYEAPLVAWLGAALFGERQTLRAAARRLPAALPPRVWPYLLWRRLSPVRSLTMTLTLLEGLRGGPRRARASLLSDGSGAGWLTIICVHFEGVLWLSGVLLLLVMVPEQLPAPEVGAFLFDDAGAAYWLGTLIGLIGMSVIAPFYVAAGFTAYLSRRTALEAWDLELRFRRAGSNARPAERPARRHPATGAALLVIGLAAALTLPGGPAGAAPAELSPDQARTLIGEVLADEDFGRQDERRIWVYIGDEHDWELETGGGLPGGLWGDLILALAQALKWLLLIAGAVALALLLRRLVLELGAGRGMARTRARTPPAPRSEPLEQRSPLPADLPAAVRDLLAAGQARAALALLYRAQIAHLRRLGLDIPDSATEAECLAAAERGATAAERDWLRRLTALWQQAAYAHRTVGVDAVAGLLAERPAAGAGP
jgi:hypothetical protein